MIKIENYEVVGWDHAIRGMRNPMNSWEKGDSERKYESWHDLSGGYIDVGPNDHELMMKLAKGGPVHAKYRRMITVYADIAAPLYWWKEFDTYKVGTVANSCSTMHKIHEKEFTMEDFSVEHLFDGRDILEKNSIEIVNYASSHMSELGVLEKYQLEGQILTHGEHDLLTVKHDDLVEYLSPIDIFEQYIINALNLYREKFIKTKKKIKLAADADEEKKLKELAKKYWWQMIQLLPSSYNQKRTVMLNYEVLAGIYKWRKNHKLDEWNEFCKWIESLPYSEIIIGEEK